MQLKVIRLLTFTGRPRLPDALVAVARHRNTRASGRTRERECARSQPLATLRIDYGDVERLSLSRGGASLLVAPCLHFVSTVCAWDDSLAWTDGDSIAFSIFYARHNRHRDGRLMNLESTGGRGSATHPDNIEEDVAGTGAATAGASAEPE